MKLKIDDMKKLALVICLTLSGQMLFAQQISVKVHGGTDSVVRISYPVEGFHYTYWDNGKSEKYDGSTALTFENTLKSPGFLFLVNNGKPVKVFAEPEKDLEIDISYSGKSRVVKVKGANAEGIELLNAGVRPFYQGLAYEYLKKDSVLVNLNRAISADLRKAIVPYDSLLKLKKISSGFYRAVERDIRCCYASVNAAVVFLDYNRLFLNVKHPLFKKTFPAEFEAGWPDVYKQFPLSDQSAALAEDFYFYAKDYMVWYKLLYLEKKAGIYKAPANDDENLRRNYEGFTRLFDGKVREFLLARLIFDGASEMRYQKELVILYGRLQRHIPIVNLRFF